MSLKWPLCHECLSEEERILSTVQRFLRENQRMSLDEVAEKLDVDSALILKFVRERRLTVSTTSVVKFNCMNCGIAILSGSLCKRCQTKLTAAPGGALPPSKLKTGDGTEPPLGGSGFRSSLRKGSLIKEKFKR